jgi:DNA-binding MarR family transcriptional regulator
MRNVYLDENFSLWTMIHHSSEVLMAVREKTIEKYALSVTELRTMLNISIIENTMEREVTASDLSKWLFRKRSTISELLTRMEKKGLIQRLPQADNKKSSIIKLTEKGKGISEEAYLEGMNFVNKAILSLSPEERHQLWIIMGKLRNLALKELKLIDKPPFPQFVEFRPRKK